MNKYNPSEIEPKWQKKWEEAGVFHASNTDTIVGNKLYAWRYPFGISLSISLNPISVRKIFSRPH